MLFSHSLENEKFNLFILFLNHLIRGEQKYKSTVDEVLKEAHALAVGEKDIYTINRDSFPIIVYLKKQDPGFFSSLGTNTSAFSTETYRKVFSILQKHPPAVAV